MITKTPKKINSSNLKSNVINEKDQHITLSNGLNKKVKTKDVKEQNQKVLCKKTKKQTYHGEQSQKKKNIQKLHNSNTFTNISVLTQRIRSCSKCCPNYQCDKNQKTFDRNSVVTSKPKNKNTKSYSLGKQTRTNQCKSAKITNKVDKKSQYMSKKVKQFETGIQSKNIQKSESQRNKFSSHIKSVEEKQFAKINIDTNMTQLQTFLNEGTQKIVAVKKSQNSFILSEMDKAQKNLINKIQQLQMQNNRIQSANQKKFDQLTKNHQIQTSKFKSQINYLSEKVDEQNTQNIKIQQKVITYETSLNQLKKEVDNKEQTIKNLRVENQCLETQNLKVNKKLQTFELNMSTLEQNIYSLKKVKQNLQNKLKKCQKEKEYIKENSIQVLKILREQCGQIFQN